MIHKIELGDEVRCRVTGFQGIVTCRTVYLQGCDKVGVQPPCGADGKWPDSWHIDVPQLDIVTKGKGLPQPDAVTEPTTKTGGPATRQP